MLCSTTLWLTLKLIICCRVIRYEDFSQDPYRGVDMVFSFFQLVVSESVHEFLNTHTRLNVGGVSSTFRNSSSAPFHWRQDLNYSEVKQIEEQCTEAMHHWGYVKARNEFSLRDLNPVTNYTLMRNIDDIGTL